MAAAVVVVAALWRIPFLRRGRARKTRTRFSKALWVPESSSGSMIIVMIIITIVITIMITMITKQKKKKKKNLLSAGWLYIV